MGFFAILHTWGQKLNLPPHLPGVVPGGGYSEKKNKWIACKKAYLLPAGVLQKRFRSLFLCGLKKLYDEGTLNCAGSSLSGERDFQDLVDTLFRTTWVVYLKEAFQSSESVIKYLARYTHRIAISNHRIIKMEDDTVTFSYKDYTDGNRKKALTLPVVEFMRRFLRHVVSPGFVRIRYFGRLSNRNKAKTLMELGVVKVEKEAQETHGETWQEVYLRVTGEDLKNCPKCKQGRLQQTEVLPVGFQRAPPEMIA
ncbi:MAG: transposase [Spirochaetota bacterium]